MSWLRAPDSALVFLISRVWVRVPVRTFVLKSKTLNHDASSFGWGVKLLWSLELRNTLIITQCTYRKDKGFALVFLVWLAGFDIAPQHLGLSGWYIKQMINVLRVQRIFSHIDRWNVPFIFRLALMNRTFYPQGTHKSEFLVWYIRGL